MSKTAEKFASGSDTQFSNATTSDVFFAVHRRHSYREFNCMLTISSRFPREGRLKSPTYGLYVKPATLGRGVELNDNAEQIIPPDAAR